MTTCRALSTIMDTQVLSVIAQIEKSKEKVAHRRAMASVRATTTLISIEGAISVLQVFGYARDTFHLKGQKWVAYDLKNERYFPDLQGRLAHETPVIWFWGGPPNALQWFKGTLQTLLDDRVMYEIMTRGASEVAKMIGIDLEGLKNVPTSTSECVKKEHKGGC